VRRIVKREPIVPARIDFDDAAAPRAVDFGDVYHPRDGALGQARHVFLGGNGLPQRWQHRKRFAILETGFGLGNNFLATWAAWRSDPARSARLHFVSIEKHPPRREDLARAHAASPLPQLAASLLAQWPPLAPNLHRLTFDGGCVELLLFFGDVHLGVREIVGRFDAFFLDGFAPALNPRMWDVRVLDALGRQAASESTAATWSVAREVRDGLSAAGFVVERAPGFAGKREMTVARYAPRFAREPPPGRRLQPTAANDALVIGGGLAGSSVAAALVDAGFACTVFDRRAEPSPEAAKRLVGIFHGVVHGHDGTHARFGRAAALHAGREIASAIATQGVPGSAAGLLRVSDEPFESLCTTAARLSLPPEYARPIDAREASSLAGVSLGRPAWLFGRGGWVQTAALCRAWTYRQSIRMRRGVEVAALRRDREQWALLDEDGRLLERAPIVVLAAAADTLRLIGAPDWPAQRVRGQTSWLAADTPGLPALRLPLAGAGYAVPLADGSLLFGATSQPGDLDPCVREKDHRFNLQRLTALTGCFEPGHLMPQAGLVGWRWVAADRLPVVGPVPDPAASAAGSPRIDQPRFAPRQHGLFVLSALASRGISWAPLAARVLAAQIAGAPWPLEASLFDAIDPARFAARRARRRGTAG
jgi:tRNA 5-methylaminomethyl-2-thiouridine biosynthesis bifunctional protein